ncbi:hypothetical protein KKF29_03965, partial [Patescibacteria group bacterium]|nr:hypothetical protein [Patescibacteria group bacterium]
MLHRNSQKRIFVQNGIYAVVIVTKDRLPFFKEEICCQILFNVIDICKQLNPKTINVYMATVYKGTWLHKIYSQEGYLPKKSK